MYMPLEIKELEFPLKICEADAISKTAITLLVEGSNETNTTVSRFPKPAGVVLICRKNPSPVVVGPGLVVDELEVEDPVVNVVVVNMDELLEDELVADEVEVEVEVDELAVDEVGVTGPPVDELVLDEAEPMTV